MGTTCEYPPPQAPPFMPNTGPKEGSLNARQLFLPKRDMASASPMLTVVLPSPYLVGFMAVTRISLALGLSLLILFIFALYLP